MEKKFSNSQRTDKSEKILKNNTPIENQEPLVSDIKESLEETIKSTLDMYKNFIVSIESTLGDQDLKNDSIDLINKSLEEFRHHIETTQYKISKIQNIQIQKNSEEE